MTEASTIEEKLELCQQAIGYRFADPRMLQNALTHASGASRRLESNERLEFLGDSILGMVICEQLFTRYPDSLEGELTKIKSTVVSRRVCARVARRLELERCLIIGRGMLNGVLPRSLLSDVFEAIIAAVYLDGGLEAARTLIESTMMAELNAPSTEAVVGNFKSVLQHYGQRELGLTPRYKLVRQFGPDHEKIFAIAAELGSRELRRRSGKARRTPNSEQPATLWPNCEASCRRITTRPSSNLFNLEPAARKRNMPTRPFARWTTRLAIGLTAAALPVAARAQDQAAADARPSLLGGDLKPTYGDELANQLKREEAENAALAAQAAERVARFGTLPAEAPAEVREDYKRLVGELRNAMAAVRREYTRHQTSNDLDPDGPRNWFEAVKNADVAFAAWLNRMAELYTDDRELYRDIALTMMEVIRVEASLDRTENILRAARVVFENPPAKLDPPLLLQIGYVGYSQGDFDLAKAAWEQYRQDATLPAEFTAFYDSIEEVREKWQRELEQREADQGRNNPIVVLETNKGLLTIELFEDQAPNAVANFMYLASHDYFKRMRLFRVIPKYCIQTGCINGDGTGNAGYQIAGENERPDRRDVFRGSLAFAVGVDPATGEPMPDTASSQFMIATTPLPGLNDSLTVFGRVIDGQFLLGTFNKIDLSDEEQQKDTSLRADILIDVEVAQKRDHEYRPEVERGQLPF